MNLVLLDAHEAPADGRLSLDGARARHIIKVLHAAPGDPLRVGIVDGPLGVATVVAVTDTRVDLHCQFEAIPPRPPVDLLLALPRPKVLRRLWAQIAALGVGHIILTNAARVERNYFDTHLLDEAAYRPLLIEGLQQARDTHVPKVSVRRQLKVLLEDELDTLCPSSLRLTAHPGAHHSLTALVRDAVRGPVLLAIGPEGGWTPYELDLLATHGFRIASAGPRTLRSDTACVALLALVHEGVVMRGDLRDRRRKENTPGEAK